MITRSIFSSFLQNITTNDFHGFIKDESRISQSSAILDIKGRIISTITLVKPLIVSSNKKIVPIDNQLFGVVCNSNLKNVLDHFQKYSFKKSVLFRDVSENFSVFNHFVI